jgi:hypothetical protein
MKPKSFDQVVESLGYLGYSPTEDELATAKALFEGRTRQQVLYGPAKASLRTVQKVIALIGWDLTWRTISTKSRLERVQAARREAAKAYASSKPEDLRLVLAKLGDTPEPWHLKAASLLWNGENSSVVRRMLRVGDSKVQAVATRIGWDLSWRTISHMKRPPNKVRMAGMFTTDQVVELYDKQGLTLQAIGDRAGVSRERVRQILEATGHDYVADRKKRRDEQKEKDRLDRKQKRFDHFKGTYASRYAEAIALWDAGVTTKAMAKLLKTTKVNVGAIIHRGRHKYGLFPYRRPEYGKGVS